MAELNKGNQDPTKDADGKKIEAPKVPKPSRKNLNLARKIVEQRATINKWPNGYDIDMVAVIGMRHETMEQDKKAAIESAAAFVALALDRGELTLGDNWAKDNLK